MLKSRYSLPPGFVTTIDPVKYSSTSFSKFLAMFSVVALAAETEGCAIAGAEITDPAIKTAMKMFFFILLLFLGL
jgi:hypothetical protein